MTFFNSPDLSGIPVLQDFFYKHESYERYHIHLIGLKIKDDESDDKDNCDEAILPRKNDECEWWCIFPKKTNVLPKDPYVTVETVGTTDTGSTDYFPIGRHKFKSNIATNMIWDSKCLLIARKNTTEAIEFVVMDQNKYRQDTELYRFMVEQSELPSTSTLAKPSWKLLSKAPISTAVSGSAAQNAVLEFQIMVTDGADRVVPPPKGNEDGGDAALLTCGYDYSEQVVVQSENNDDDDDDDNSEKALLQCWCHRDGSSKAVFWIIGRHDCFMHPHVARQLFCGNDNEDDRYDLYVLNYQMNGQCRKRGWVQDAHYNSHNKHGSFDIYIPIIQQCLNKISSRRTYEKLLGYAHSTGAPVLLNDLMEKGDDAFDAFIFNSPFLDWGFVGGDLVEFILEHTHLMVKLGTMKNDTKLGVPEIHPDLADKPIPYLGQDIVMCDWTARVWSMYYFDFESRPLYKTPVTVGFARGVTAVHKKLKARQRRAVITAKPFLCITSRGDDILEAPETLGRADWIGPSRAEIELNENAHDVFLSNDPADSQLAIEFCRDQQGSLVGTK